MRYFGSNLMFFCFDDCLIKFSHCFKLFIICLFHVILSQLNADMKMFKPFCRLSIRSTHCSKGNEDCFVLMPIVSLVRKCLISMHIVQKHSRKGVVYSIERCTNKYKRGFCPERLAISHYYA